MNEEKKKKIQRIMKERGASWSDETGDDATDPIVFSTRENGDVGEEEFGMADDETRGDEDPCLEDG